MIVLTFAPLCRSSSELYTTTILVTGNEEPKELTVHLVKNILIKYNENDLAQDYALLQEMVDAAGATFTAPDDDMMPLLLDRNYFLSALTSDILLYDARCENSSTKNWEDVGLLKAQYLLKIKHGEAHNRAGSVWRMLFVTTLMPWLQKYRQAAKKSHGAIGSGDEERPDDEVQSIVSSEEDYEAALNNGICG